MKVLNYFDKNIFILCLTSIVVFISPLLAPTILAKAGSYADFYKAWFLQSSLPVVIGIWALINIFYKNNTIKFTISSLHVWLFLLLVISSMSLIWAYHKNLGIIDLSRWLVAGGLFFLIVQLIQPINHIHVKIILLTAVIGSCTVVTVIGVLQHFNMFDFYLQAVSPAAGFGNRNVAMHFIMLGLPVVVFLFFIARKLYFLIPLSIINCLMLIYIQNSDNRTVMIGFFLELIAFLCLLFYFRKHNNYTFSKITKSHIIAILLTITTALIIGNLDSKLQVKSWNEISPVKKITTRTATIVERKRLILNSLHMIKDYFWAGVGFGNWSLYYPKYAGKYYLSECMSTEYPNARVLYKLTHNEWLQTFAEIGFLGFFCFFMVIMSILYMIYSIITTQPKSKEAILAASFFISILGISANMSASFPLRVSIPAAVIFCYAAIIFKDYKRLTVNNKNHKSAIKKLCYLLMGKSKEYTLNTNIIVNKSFSAVAAIVCLTSGYHIYKAYDGWIEAHQYRNLAAIAMENDRIDLAIDFIEYSLKVNPADPDNLYYSLGNLYLFKNKPQKAIEAYDRSIRHILPYTPFTYQMLASAYVQSGLIQHAVSLLKEAIEIMPLQGGYYYVLGDALARLQKLPEALDYYKKALKYAPNHPWAEAAKKILNSSVDGASQ